MSQPSESSPSMPLADLNREKISAFIIAFNEEDQIEACVRSVLFCDEVLVIDSFSTDRTVEIAKALGARVVQRAWPGYREQKAYGLASSTHEWVLNLDADERVTPALQQEILDVLKEQKRRRDAGKEVGTEVAGYYINRVVFYLGRWWRLGGWYPEYRMRFFRKSTVTWGGIDPHEKPIVEGRTSYLKGELEHYTYHNLDEQFQRLHSLSTLAAREDFKRGKRASLFKLIVNPLLRVLKFYVVKKGYREGQAGLIVAVAEGYYTFMKYAKLWEHEFNERLSAPGSSAQGSSADVRGKRE